MNKNEERNHTEDGEKKNITLENSILASCYNIKGGDFPLTLYYTVVNVFAQGVGSNL